MVLDEETLKKMRETLDQQKDKHKENMAEFNKNTKEVTTAQKEKETNLNKVIGKKKQSKGCSIL